MTDRAGTPESAWTPWLADLPDFPAAGYRHAVVVAAHPDDETLGVSGLLQHLHAAGTRVDLVVATDGEAAFPDQPADRRAELGRLRRSELVESLRAQGVGDVAVRWLGLPDSGLARHGAELVTALRDALAEADLCLSPWVGDPHPDHQAVGAATRLAAPVTAHCFGYPVWAWHWLHPEDDTVPRARAHGHRLTEAQRERKAAGIAAFDSQLRPGPAGEDPILEPAMLRHFDRDREVLVREPVRAGAPVARFAELYASDPDPWRVNDSWYERRKRQVTLACLPDERYGLAIEPACGVGALTRELAARCDRLVAFDPVPDAVRRATTATAALPQVRVDIAALPDGLPDGPADLVVFSEILYYLAEDDLTATIEAAVRALRPGGQVLAAHWLPWAPEAPRDGAEAHRGLLAHPALDPVVGHLDARFVVHVLSRR